MKATPETGILWRVASTHMPTKWGMFDAIGFERDISKRNSQELKPRSRSSWAILREGSSAPSNPFAVLHRREVLGSLRCDCGDQLAMAMQAIADEGRGLVIYEYQEGRGIGLMAKLQAYELQDAGIDTIEANHALGFKADYRDFSLPAAILRDLGVGRARLLTNNPHKARALTNAGIEVVSRIRCEAAPTSHSLAYLRTKKERMGHALSLRHHDNDGSFASDAASDMFAWRRSDHNRTVEVAREI